QVHARNVGIKDVVVRTLPVIIGSIATRAGQNSLRTRKRRAVPRDHSLVVLFMSIFGEQRHSRGNRVVDIETVDVGEVLQGPIEEVGRRGRQGAREEVKWRGAIAAARQVVIGLDRLEASVEAE